MSLFIRRNIPLYIGLLCFAIVLGGVFLQYTPIDDAAGLVRNWATLIAPFLLTLGTITLVRRHVRNVMRKGERWYLSIYLVVLLGLTILLGLTFGMTSSEYLFVYNTFYIYPFTTVATLHGFSTMVSFYRMARIRSIESAFFVLSAVMIIMTNAKFGSVISPVIPEIGTWINNNAAAAAMRAVLIASGIAAISQALKSLLGMERGWLGKE